MEGLATHDGHGVDGGVVLLDEELDEGGEALHGGVVEGRPARLRLAVDEGVPLQQRLAHLRGRMNKQDWKRPTTIHHSSPRCCRSRRPCGERSGPGGRRRPRGRCSQERAANVNLEGNHKA